MLSSHHHGTTEKDNGELVLNTSFCTTLCETMTNFSNSFRDSTQSRLALDCCRSSGFSTPFDSQVVVVHPSNIKIRLSICNIAGTYGLKCMSVCTAKL